MAPMRYTPAQQHKLLVLARQSIEAHLGEATIIFKPAAEFSAPAACFVTLHLQGRLRGCIGNLEPELALDEAVWINARKAAFSDYRFAPLSREELSAVRIEISILTPPQPLAVSSEAELVQRLRPGIDGLVLDDGKCRATFLPTVWQSLRQPEQFVHQLKLKGGWPEGYWSEAIKCFTYRAEKFAERL